MAELGRPTEYSKDILAKLGEFLDMCERENRLPTIERLSTFLGVARSTLYLWSKEHPDFSDILDSIMAYQGDTLIQKGLKGEYNPTITKLMLTKHGYADRQEVTGKDGEPLFDEKARAQGKAAIEEYLGNTGKGE